MDIPKRFIEYNSESSILTKDSYDGFLKFVKEKFNLNSQNDIIIYVKTESDGIYQVEPKTYKDLKDYLNRKKDSSKLLKSVINISEYKSYFRPGTEEYIINSDKIGLGYIYQNEFYTKSLGRDLEPEYYEKRNERFLTSKIEENVKNMLEREKKKEIDYLEEKKKEMDQAYKDLLKSINDLTRDKNVYYKSYFEKVLRNKLFNQGIILETPKDNNINDEDMKCCFCGENMKLAFHYQNDEKYVVCERCVEIHSDYFPFNFVKNKVKKVVNE